MVASLGLLGGVGGAVGGSTRGGAQYLDGCGLRDSACRLRCVRRTVSWLLRCSRNTDHWATQRINQFDNR